MKSRSDLPSKDELCYSCDDLLQFLVHTNFKETVLRMRKGHALNAPIEPFSIRRRPKEDLHIMRQRIPKDKGLYISKAIED